MKRRKLLLGITLLSVVVAGGLVPFWPGAGAGISKETAERITPGMTLRQAEDLIGMPAADYSSGFVGIQLMVQMSGGGCGLMNSSVGWFCDSGCIQLTIDENGVVTHCRYFAYPEPWWARVRRVLHLN